MQSPMSEIATYMRRVEVMKRANHLAEIHYRAWHFWLWFIPISVSIGVVLLLSFANAANVMSVNERAGMKLSVSMGFFAFLAQNKLVCSKSSAETPWLDNRWL